VDIGFEFFLKSKSSDKRSQFVCFVMNNIFVLRVRWKLKTQDHREREG
jgi:hypothetical protein